MTKEEFVRKDSWILAVIRDRCELTQAEKDYLNILIEVLEQEPCEDATLKDIFCMGCEYKEQEPTAKENLVVGDCISRKAVLDGIEELKRSPWCTDKRGIGFEYLITEALEVVADLCVKREPSVTPKPKTGHWILIDKELLRYKCSECGEVIRLYKKSEISKLEKDETLSDYPFSHCGCRMVEPQESEE